MNATGYQTMSERTVSSPTHSCGGRNAIVVAVCLLALTVPPPALALSVAPTSLSFSTTPGGTSPASQSITFWKGGDRVRKYTVSVTSPWVTVTPSTGTLAAEQDQVRVSVNPSGLSGGSYATSVVIAIEGLRGRISRTAIPVSLTVGGTSPAPSISLNPSALSFSGVAGGTAPAAQVITLTNPSGGTLSWTASDNAAWLSLSASSGTTTTEADSISASVNPAGLTAGTYSGAITVSAAGATSKTIPVSFTVNPPTTAGSARLTWTANTESDLAGYKVYVGTKSGVYGPPITVGNVTTYQLNNLAMNTTYFVSITAVDTAGNESLHSAEVSKSIF